MLAFFIHSMGCKSNQYEGSIIYENLIKNGLKPVDSVENADIFILNSCSVTHKSDNEAMYLLRNAKHKNPNIFNIITGCIAQIEKENLLKYEYVDLVVGNDEKFNIYEILRLTRHSEQSEESHKILPQNDIFVSDISQKKEFNKTVLENTTKTRVSIKIQDGCDNRCSYCIIPFARGKSRSADIDFVVEQINKFSKCGFKEVVLTGIHIGQWGRDLGLKFTDLIKSIEEKTSIERYRFGSLNPLEIDDDLLLILSNSTKFCPHFHLSLQSACDKTLKSMNRFYKVEDYLKQIEKINEIFDLPFLGSDIITGFAGETDEDFNVTVKNLKLSGLSQIHTFPYSIRKGTKGATKENHVPESIRQKRAEIVKKISQQKLNEFIAKNIGTTREILIEKQTDKKTGNLKGITRNYLTVILNSKDINLQNTIQKVNITEYSNGRIYGKLVD